MTLDIIDFKTALSFDTSASDKCCVTEITFDHSSLSLGVFANSYLPIKSGTHMETVDSGPD